MRYRYIVLEYREQYGIWDTVKKTWYRTAMEKRFANMRAAYLNSGRS